MAYLMSDVAAGGQAALQLQQQMAAAPNVQQVEANKMQEQAFKLQQDQLTIERNKLSNLIADTGFKVSEDARGQLQKAMQSPEAKDALAKNDAVALMKLALPIQATTGDMDGYVKTQNAISIAESKKIADQVKVLDNNDRELYKAAAVVNGVAEDKIGETFNSLPESSKKSVIAEVGQANWDKFSNAEKKAVLNNLMMAGIRRNAAQSIAVDANKQNIIGNYKVEAANIHETEATKRKVIGEAGAMSREKSREAAAMERVEVQEAGRTERAEESERGKQRRFDTKEKRLSWNEYNVRRTEIEGRGNRILSNLMKDVKEKEDAMQKAAIGSDSKAQMAATQAWNNAKSERDEYQRSLLQKQYDLALNAPDSFAGKQRVLDGLKVQMELVGKKEETPKPTTDKAKGTPVPTATSNKPAEQKFEEGKVYTDAKGNKAKYVNGKWEPQ
jgi:hypothetical protein